MERTEISAIPKGVAHGTNKNFRPSRREWPTERTEFSAIPKAMAYGTHRISAVAKCLKNHRNRCLCLRVAQTQTAEGPSAHNLPSHDSNPSIRKVRPATPPHRILSCVVVVLSLSSTPWTSVHDAKFSKSGSDVTDFGPPRNFPSPRSTPWTSVHDAKFSKSGSDVTDFGPRRRRREIFQVHDRRHGLRSATRNFLSPGAFSKSTIDVTDFGPTSPRPRRARRVLSGESGGCAPSCRVEW